MEDFNVIDGERNLIRTKDGNLYLFISDRDIFITIPTENDPKLSSTRTFIEAICRISNKAFKLGLTLKDVALQLEEADMGKNTVLKKISLALLDYKGLR